MTIIERVQANISRRDEQSNQQLAEEILQKKDKKDIANLVTALQDKNKDLQNDCIKILYEIGEKDASLISGYAEKFITLLDTKNNRLQWGLMTAIKTITREKSALIFQSIPKLAAIVETGTVITRDNFVAILIILMGEKNYCDAVFPLFNEQLLACPSNQLPMYAENAASIVPEKYKQVFERTLRSRLDDFEKESKRKRVEKILSKLHPKK